MASEEFLNAVTDAETDEAVLVILRLTIPGGATLYFVGNDADITHGGQVHTAFGFEFVEPAVGSGSRTPARLRIDNLDRQIVQVILDLTDPPLVLAKIIKASAPDVVERTFPEFELKSITWNLMTIEGALQTPDDQDEPVCSHSYTPQNAPGLFVQ